MRLVPCIQNAIIYKLLLGNETNEIIEELFESLLQRYKEGLEEVNLNLRGSEFIFDSIDLLCYKLHKISVNRDRLYIDSPEWLKNEKITINLKNNDDKSFQYALTVALHYQSIKKYSPKKNNNNKKLSLLLVNIIEKK